MVTKVTAPPTDDLAALAAAIDAGPATAEQQEQAEQEEAEEANAADAMEKMKAGAARMAFSALKAVRARVSKTLPEINEEWPDDMLKAPAEAVVPVFEKYAGVFFKGMGNYPELGMLFFSLLPLAGGYIGAIEKQNARTVEEPK